MKKNNRITPEGTRDYLFEECMLRRKIEHELSGVFLSRCYHEVVTPGFEFYDVYDPDFSGIPQEAMFKMTDRQGRLMVMRPDNTLSIARLTATRLQKQPKPIRLYYTQPVYRSHKRLSGRNDENIQMGVELLGASGLRADLEAISLAVESLNGCVPGFRLEIGHAGIFRALAERLPDCGEREDIRAAVESKNYAALNDLLAGMPDCPEVRALRELPHLFGGEEVFSRAADLCTGKLRQTLEYLHGIYTALKGLNLGNRLIVDLGLVQRNDYYTGIVFSAYVEEYGDAVLLGGRYDTLLEHFGQAMPAVGFGVNVDAIEQTILSRGSGCEIPRADILVFGERGYEMRALEHSSRLAAEGYRCENSAFSTRAETLEYAGAADIRRVDIVSDQIESIDTGRRDKE